MRKFVLLLCLWLAYPAASAFAEHHTLIVLSQDDHMVYDINPISGEVVKRVALPGAPREATLSWDEQTLFVSVPDAGQIAIVDVKTFKLTGQVTNAEFKRPAAGSLGSPLGLANSADGGKLYVGVEGGLLVYDERLLVLNPEFKQAGKKIAVTPKDGRYFKVQGTTDKLYYPNRQDNQVVVIDTKTDSVVKMVPVSGGPVDVVFMMGGEAWVQCEDGTIAVIDTSKDTVKQVIQTGGKGMGRITIAPDIRYIASTHADTGDVAILHPLDKKVVATVKTGAGPAVPAFAPAAKSVQDFLLKDPTNQLYVTNAGDSDVAVVDLDKMAVSSHQKTGKGLVGSLIHYKYSDAFSAPREGTCKRLMETDVFIARENAMFLYDVSPVHEHRNDMAGVFTGTGVNKIGCWDPVNCPNEVVPGRYSIYNLSPGGLPYSNGEGEAGGPTSISRGTIHIEEGGSVSPRRFVLFDIKNNYYRQTAPAKPTVITDKRFRQIYQASAAAGFDNPRYRMWDVWLRPGDKPIDFPEGDLAVVYLSGGLLRIDRDGTPEVVNRYFNDWDWEPKAHRVESLTNAVHMVVVEFK